jgi:PIN domain nuclease of toxin-antitoxin system
MYVTDPHPIIWYATGKHSQLSPKVLKAFQKADNGDSLIYISAVTLWEIALLESIGKIKLANRFDYWANTLLAKIGFEIIHLEPSIIANSIGYNFNNDSFDKVIVASAIQLDLPLITKDTAITDSNLVETYW